MQMVARHAIQEVESVATEEQTKDLYVPRSSQTTVTSEMVMKLQVKNNVRN